MLTPACVSAGLVLVLGFAACQSTADELPPIPKPLGYATVLVDLPGCPDRLPPVHDVARCSPDDIGTRIDSRDVCRVLMGLKDWVEYGRTRLSSVAPSDWQFVRSSCVSRGVVAVARPHDPPRLPVEQPETILRLYVDLPERAQVLFAQMSERTKQIDYYVSPR